MRKELAQRDEKMDGEMESLKLANIQGDQFNSPGHDRNLQNESLAMGIGP